MLLAPALLPSLPATSAISGHAKDFDRDLFGLYERCEKLGPLVRIRLYHRPLYVVTGPDLIEQVLVHQAPKFDKPMFLKGSRWIFGEGLLVADGARYQHRRRIVQPAFHPAHHAAYTEMLAQRVARMLSDLAPGTHDVYQLVVDVCLTQLTGFFYGVESPGLSATIRDVALMCHEVEQDSRRAPWTFLLPGVHRRRHAKRIRGLDAALEALRRRRAAEPDGPPTFFDRLVRGEDHDGCPMRPSAVRDEAVTIALAGHETAAAAVSWALYLLAKHPAALSRLRAELDEHVAGRLPALDELPRLSYLNAVLKETYRLYPPTHRIGRTTNAAVELGGVRLPKGSELQIPQWAVHRSSRWYDEPKAFRPERWLSDRARLPRYAYFPFGGGLHTCPGQQVAQIEDALLVAGLAGRFEPSLTEDAPGYPASGLTLLPCPVGVTLAERQAPNARPVGDAEPSGLAEGGGGC